MMTWSVEFENPATDKTKFVEVKANSAIEAIFKAIEQYAHLVFISCRVVHFNNSVDPLVEGEAK